MGTGIATGFRGRYPGMCAEYRRRCKAEGKIRRTVVIPRSYQRDTGRHPTG